MSLDSLMVNRITVKRASSTKDVAGGFTQAEVTLATSVPCRIDRASEPDVLRFAQFGVNLTHEIYTRRSDWLSGDIVIDEAGRTYVVESFNRELGIGTLTDYTVVYCVEQM